MKYSDKLDLLQEMAREHAGEAYALYLIGLLAEHAEEDECMDGFFGWVREIIGR